MHPAAFVIGVLVQGPTQTAASVSACEWAGTHFGSDIAVVEICAGEQATGEAATATGGDRVRALQRAADHFERAATTTHHAAKVRATQLLADCYDEKRLNEPREMESALRSLIILEPNDLAYPGRLSRLQERQGLLEVAEATLLDARRQRPDAADAYKFLAQFYARRVTAMTADVAKREASAPTSGPGEPDSNGVYRVGGSLAPPTRMDVPQYPEDAKAAGIAGVVVAEVVIDGAGRVTDAKIVRSIPLLDEAALTAVRHWRFAPSVVNGSAVPVRMNVNVNFTTR